MTDKTAPIGVFDSGVGGISVLRELVRQMPGENYIFYGDSANAPYGTRPLEEIRELSMVVAEYLISRGVKALVVACNTATSACVRILRNKYPDMPIVGLEPAVKPATLSHPGGNIAILATEMTVKQPKFNALMDRYKDQAHLIPVPASELVECVERGELDSPRLEATIQMILNRSLDTAPDAIVLGCTHFPFVRKAIEKVAHQSDVFDGSEGAAHYCKTLLEEKDLCNPAKTDGDVEIMNSSGDVDKIMLCFELLDSE